MFLGLLYSDSKFLSRTFTTIKYICAEIRKSEIGYGLGKTHEHFGYMTEAVEAFCTWGKKQASVKHIIAETEIDNFSSQRVLQRNGFIEYFRDKTIWWKL